MNRVNRVLSAVFSESLTSSLSLIHCLFLFIAVVCSELPRPENVTLHTLNTHYVLKWDWDEGADDIDRTTFTTQYLPKFKITKPLHKQTWRSACGVTFKHLCDFTALHIHYYGEWLLRVRAERGRLVSRWAQIEFCPERDAGLGPPSRVDVTSIDGHLHVSISDPVSSTNSSMRELHPNLSYLTQYWKRSSQMQLKSLQHESNLVTLPEVENWTWYCVRVQSREPYYNKTSVFTPTHCLQTDGHIPFWQIFLWFLLSLVLSFVFVFMLCYGFYTLGKVVKNTLHPVVSLPTHIHQYFQDSPGSDRPHLLTTEVTEEHICDRFDVIPESVVADFIMESYTSTEDSSQGPKLDDGLHSRHSSGDSGIYSTAEYSGSGRSASKDGPWELKSHTVGRAILPRELGDTDVGQEEEVCV
ncbi:interferon alpha/beta receptor 1b-like [Brachyhypopomus gauderio]|uniref:interferon alpha/beta receptor 1b-like n=1 Tax=Brachyhypopomus gauderio TaxID=698409 RepID=UPI0040421410